MPRNRPFKGLHRFKHKVTGIWYTYHRESGKRLEPPHVYGTPAFVAALADAERAWQSKQSIIATWGKAVEGYKASSDFKLLAPRTQSDYEKQFEYLEVVSDLALTQIDTPTINKIKEKCFEQHGRRRANYVVAILSIVFGYAIQHGLFTGSNPASRVKKVKKPKSAPEANVPWTEKEIAIFLEHARPDVAAPFSVAMNTGMRSGDVLKIPKTSYRDGHLNVRTGKTGIIMPYPVTPALAALIDALPPHDGDTLFVSSRGTPWTSDGFRHAFFKLRDALADRQLIRKELTIHGLRTTVGQLAAEIGFNMDQIADGLGHKDTSATKIYVREAGRVKNVKRMIESVAANRSEIDLATRLATLPESPPKAPRKSLK